MNNKLLLLFFAAVVCSAGYGRPSTFAKQVKQESSSQLDSNMQKEKTFSLFADALFWKLEEIGAYWGNAVSTFNEGPKLVKQVNVKTFDFPWDWGFRVGLRGNLGYEDWDLQAYYTWFKTHKSSQSNQETLPTFMGTYNALGLIDYDSGSSEWRFLFSMFDIELGKNCFVSKTLLFHPFIGIKGGWIYQKVSTDLILESLSGSETVKNHFYGIGTSGGLSGDWMFSRFNGNSLSLFYNFSGALMWGRWIIKDIYQNTSPTTIYTKVPESFYGTFTTKSLLGFAWQADFKRSAGNVLFRLGYEMQFWLNQLQYLTTFTGKNHHDLTLQGGLFEACFNF